MSEDTLRERESAGTWGCTIKESPAFFWVFLPSCFAFTNACLLVYSSNWGGWRLVFLYVNTFPPTTEKLAATGTKVLREFLGPPLHSYRTTIFPRHLPSSALSHTRRLFLFSKGSTTAFYFCMWHRFELSVGVCSPQAGALAWTYTSQAPGLRVCVLLVTQVRPKFTKHCYHCEIYSSFQFTPSIFKRSERNLRLTRFLFTYLLLCLTIDILYAG